MQSSTSKNIDFQKVSIDSSLLVNRNEKLDHLLELAKRVLHDPDKTIILVQESPLNFYSSRWLSEIVKKSYRIDQTELVLVIRYLLRLIKKSSARWIYVSREKCLGTFAEFALACDKHICTSTQLKFGFPELLAGMMPWGGIFESLIRSNSRLIESWKQYPIRISGPGESKFPVIFIPHGSDLDFLPSVLEKWDHISKKTPENDELLRWYGKTLEEGDFKSFRPFLLEVTCLNLWR